MRYHLCDLSSNGFSDVLRTKAIRIKFSVADSSFILQMFGAHGKILKYGNKCLLIGYALSNFLIHRTQ